MSQQDRIGRLIILLGLMGTGKTWFIIQNLLKLNQRNLIIPANRYDKAWNGYRKINWEKILVDVTGLHPRQAQELEKEKNASKKNDFYEAMGEVFLRIRGNVLLPITVKQKVIFNAVLDQDCGFKKGGFTVDDFTGYLPEGRVPDDLKVMITEMRHRELDIFLAAHNPDFVPPRLFRYGPEILLWRTESPFKKVYDKGVWDFETYRTMEEIRERVNKVAALGKKFGDTRKYYHEWARPQATGGNDIED